jgi:hypothetical protein
MATSYKTMNFEIRFRNKDRAYFEHKELGEDCGGGLWFKDKALVDYDGVYDLPTEVKVWLFDNNFRRED